MLNACERGKVDEVIVKKWLMGLPDRWPFLGAGRPTLLKYGMDGLTVYVSIAQGSSLAKAENGRALLSEWLKWKFSRKSDAAVAGKRGSTKR